MVDERIILLRLKHTLGFMSLVAVYVPTEVCGEEEMFYAKLDCSGSMPLLGHTHCFWATSMLPLPLKELATSYMLFPMAMAMVL